MGACREATVGERFPRAWFQGVESVPTGKPPVVISEDYPSVRDEPSPAAAELDRLAAMVKIDWYPRGCHPFTVCVRLS